MKKCMLMLLALALLGMVPMARADATPKILAELDGAVVMNDAALGDVYGEGPGEFFLMLWSLAGLPTDPFELFVLLAQDPDLSSVGLKNSIWGELQNDFLQQAATAAPIAFWTLRLLQNLPAGQSPFPPAQDLPGGGTPFGSTRYDPVFP